MAVGYHPNDDPSDYGLTDWWHDPDGKVNYSWLIDDARIADPEHPIDFKKLAKEQDNSYREYCTEQALDNLAWERDHISARHDAFDEWERNQIVYN